MRKRNASEARRERMAKIAGHYADPLSPLDEGLRGVSFFGLTFGKTRFLDVLELMLHHAAPASVDIMSWNMDRKTAELIADWIALERITRLRLVVDGNFRALDEERFNYMLELMGVDNVKVAPVHAKCAAVCGDGFNLLYRSSMNPSGNPRIEQIDITDHKKTMCAFVGLMDVIWDSIEAPTIEDIKKDLVGDTGDDLDGVLSLF